MAGDDALRDVREYLENPKVRWFLVIIGVVVLLRMRLILFAAALPVMAYWHYSSQGEEQQGGEPGTAADDDADFAIGPEDQADDDGMYGNPNEPSPRGDGEVDPYDQSFWDGDNDIGPSGGGGAGGGLPKRSAPSAAPPSRVPESGGALRSSLGADDDDDFGDIDKRPVKDLGTPWDDDADLGGPLDDLPGLKEPKGMGSLDKDFGSGGGGATAGGSAGLDGDDLFGGGRNPLGGLGGLGSLGGLGGPDDLDFLGGGGGGGLDDMDFLSPGFGGGGRGKGKGKGKGKDREKGGFGGKGEKGPREPNPKQVFIAGIGDLPEDEIQEFFERVGEVDRLKVLTNPDGSSKGVCFITFRTEEQAQKALTLHGSHELQGPGRMLTVRLAHGGNKGAKGEGKSSSMPLDFGPSERFGPAFGDDGRGDRDRDRGHGGFGERGPGRGGKGGRGRGRERTDEVVELLEDALAEAPDGPLKVSDFDFAAKRFLAELRARDRADNTNRFQEAVDMVLKYTVSKDRSSVRKWPAYVFTLLQKFDTPLADELRERDAERRREKGGGGFGGRERAAERFGGDDRD